MIGKHIFTFILLILAAIAFALNFFVIDKYKIYCNTASFILPVVAAVIECCFAIKCDKELKNIMDGVTWG